MFKQKTRDLSDLNWSISQKITLARPTSANFLRVFGLLTGQYSATKARQNWVQTSYRFWRSARMS